MPKVKVTLGGFKLEVAKFEVEVTGERNEIPALRDAAMKHVQGVLSRGGQVIDGAAVQGALPFGNSGKPIEVTTTAEVDVTTPKRGQRRGRLSAKHTGSTNAAPLEWKPDPQRFGEPKVDWSNFEKGAWLLYCHMKENSSQGLAAEVITATFNKHFPKFKQIVFSYLGRDLQRNATKAEPYVTEDSSMTPSTWYLTEYGEKLVENLIAKAKAPSANGTA